MAIKTVSVEDSRVGLRDVLDAVHAGTSVIIEHHHEPSAVVINYEQWQVWRAAQQKEDLAHAKQVIADIESGKARKISHEDLLQKLLAKQSQASD